MRKTIKILLFISFVFIVNCGYTPLFDSNKIDFYFSEVNFVGDKQINNYLNSVLKQHQNYSESKKKFTLNLLDRGSGPKDFRCLLFLISEVFNNLIKPNFLTSL